MTTTTYMLSVEVYLNKKCEIVLEYGSSRIDTYVVRILQKHVIAFIIRDILASPEHDNRTTKQYQKTNK